MLETSNLIPFLSMPQEDLQGIQDQALRLYPCQDILERNCEHEREQIMCQNSVY